MIEILLVEDDEYICDSLAVFFSHSDYHVVSAESGEKGMILVQENCFDVIVADRVLPGMSGLEFMKKIEYVDAVKILISGSLSPRQIKEARSFGVNTCIEKPFKAEFFESTIRDLVSRSK